MYIHKKAETRGIEDQQEQKTLTKMHNKFRSVFKKVPKARQRNKLFTIYTWK